MLSRTKKPSHGSRDAAERALMRDVSKNLPQRHVVDVDPEDPSQQLDDTGEFHIEPLAVEAQPAAEALEELDIAAAENVEGESEQLDEDVQEPVEHDTGDLYGVRTPHASDTTLSASEDHDSFEGSTLGETWLEALEERAAVMGPVPEEEVVIVDDSDEHAEHRGHHPSDWRDRPVADKGSGGTGGL